MHYNKSRPYKHGGKKIWKIYLKVKEWSN
jgi:hypothetical protein